jgi:flagellar assembly factor FliW
MEIGHISQDVEQTLEEEDILILKNKEKFMIQMVSINKYGINHEKITNNFRKPIISNHRNPKT